MRIFTSRGHGNHRGALRQSISQAADRSQVRSTTAHAVGRCVAAEGNFHIDAPSADHPGCPPHHYSGWESLHRYLAGFASDIRHIATTDGNLYIGAPAGDRLGRPPRHHSRWESLHRRSVRTDEPVAPGTPVMVAGKVRPTSVVHCESLHRRPTGVDEHSTTMAAMTRIDRATHDPLQIFAAH